MFLAVGYVHRDFKTETHVDERRCSPLHMKSPIISIDSN